MNYDEMTSAYMELMYKMRRKNAHKQINDSIHGENIILYIIYLSGGDMLPGTLSEMMNVSTARIAAALNRLEAKGLIIRTPDDKDRRKTRISITDAGRKITQEREKKIRKGVSGMLKYLGEEDAMQFLRIMQRISDKCLEDFENCEDDLCEKDSGEQD